GPRRLSPRVRRAEGAPHHRERRADGSARLGDHGALHDRGAAGDDRGRARARPGRRRRTGGAAAGRRSADDGGARRPLRRALPRAPGPDRRGRSRHTRPSLLRPGDRARYLRRHDNQQRGSGMTRKRIALVGIAGALALFVAGSAGANVRSHTGTSAVSGSISFDGIWTSSSGQKQFADVIAAFNKLYPNVKVNYKPVGNNLPTVLATAVAGGHPPDMAD